MPERSKGMIQTNRGTLVLQVGGWAEGQRPTTVKNYCYENSRNEPRRKRKWRGPWQFLRIGTWNVLTLHRPGASTTLKQELEKVRMDLVALQEVRWLGTGTLEKKNCAIFHSCNLVRHVLGVGFYVNWRLLPNILRFEPVNDRLCWIRVCKNLEA